MYLDKTDSSSGLDGSISFEADRDENLGLVFTTAVSGTDHQSFINETIMAV